MTSTNITLRIPGDSELVRRLGRHPLLRLGRALVRVLWDGLSGESEEAGMIVGLMLAHLRREAIDEHAAAVADEFDETNARKALDRIAEINAAIGAVPESAQPSGAKFWVHSGILYAATCPGVGVSLAEGGWVILAEISSEDARVFARLLGGELLDRPPQWWLDRGGRA